MKTLSVLLIGVLSCTQVFAGWTIDPDLKSASASAVTRAAGSKLVKVFYKSSTIGKVEVSISNSDGEKIFTDVIQKTSGFVRPYNFGELPEGEYTVAISDEYGTTIEKISYSDNVDKFISVKKIGNENRYLLTIVSQQKDDVTILISDADDNLVYREAAKIGNEFAKVYNIKNLKNFFIEVSDAKGVLKKVKY